MEPDLEAAIQRQWADDEEYVATCRFIELDIEANWQIEARFRSARPIAPFVFEILRREWQEVAVVRTPEGDEELLVRREQPLTLEVIKDMTASLFFEAGPHLQTRMAELVRVRRLHLSVSASDAAELDD